MLFDTKKESGELVMYGGIGPGEITETMFLSALDEMGGQDIVIKFNSEGGCCFAGKSMYSNLANYPGKTTVRIDSICASIATIVAMGADVIEVSPVADMMIHRSWTIALGNCDDLRDCADLLDSMDTKLATIYANRTNGDYGYWLDLMEKESWFGAEESVAVGLADGIYAPAKKVSARNYGKPTPRAEVSAYAGLGPAAKTRLRALERRRELLSSGVLTN